jgi:hypothetical protein
MLANWYLIYTFYAVLFILLSAAIFLLLKSCQLICTQYMLIHVLYLIYTFYTALFILLWATVPIFSFNSTTTCHLPPATPSPSRTTRHGYMATPTTNVHYLGADITLRDGVSFIRKGTFTYSLMSYMTLTYACTQTPDYGCLLFIPP